MFCPKGGQILDPFAGGSVRGIVAAKTGRLYQGVDIRPEQVVSNQEQAEEICTDPVPVWQCGDSTEIKKIVGKFRADMVFSCPPYADLEVYSDNPKDLSTMSYPDFLKAYRVIIKNCFDLLDKNRFAVWVIGEVRSKDGTYYNFLGDTISAFLDAGFYYYNEAVLVTTVGSLPIRVGKSFSQSRKLGKTHQNILVFVKGDPRLAAEACGEVEINIDDDGLDDVSEYGEEL